ncbi:RNA polymerase sigma-70 factor [Mucilaginibacter lappiensis]|uniref:RNA polymerase sigma-70 factor (ECF subfamily) n=1 Tax=Mucilaginibacter lappiensis TaxID=354630 RepID=A0A1N7BY67_9SPHI|nr:RNA polymerase sigma-70 factor [Mucilaginibacter lappiensis]MBB6109973.1 RNA polymerase sigma-70 factor (ECF subfamily) [Mucilaginibacter lappiensis]MBB6126687.1 RNA polymerase sigma-70 factor (ECF subfamily) [Mucilaginibacter lappiensis]SIR56311.1 RNA polymerase sigma-70 factor, ECF subfamily [Mucilaginibacter lappiensis]
MTPLLTDSELWDAVVADSSRAFVVLYNRYWKKLYKTVCYYLKDESAAEEITHDVFVVLWTRRKHLKINSFQNYIHVTARYHVFKHLKAARINGVEYIEQFAETEDMMVYNTADSKLSYESFETELAQILKELPRRCQEIFWLSRVQNLSNDEIADRLNISKRTVENQITQALKYLRISYPKLSVVSSVLIMTLFLAGVY